MALELFHFQYHNNTVYKKYIDTLKTDPANINRLETIPFLPVSFFKTHNVVTTSFEPEVVFESSGTTGVQTSRHKVKDMNIYRESFLKTFSLFYGSPANWCIAGLLPGYLERGNSSLVAMVHDLIAESCNHLSGFYLNDHDKLFQTLVSNEMKGQRSLLFGVTFALLDFSEKFPMNLKHTTVIETGGMKGRREEITREEVHSILKERWGLSTVHSEYGMTELLSQAYSTDMGRFRTPPWMKILLREYNDPFSIRQNASEDKPLTGLINVIDLANIYSCAFLAVDDVGRLYKNGEFEVLGRRDQSDLRGCSLLVPGT